MRETAIGRLTAILLLLCCSECLAQNAIEATARRQIDAGNQAWIEGMKQGNVGFIAATYTMDAVDCSQTGDCIQGRSAIEKHMKEEMTKVGKANSASVNSIGSVQQGHFVYEWGEAEASFSDGSKIVDKYLTAWREEPDGSWKIFRNLVIPGK
jgi:ketosteroid isomerase-like protein